MGQLYGRLYVNYVGDYNFIILTILSLTEWQNEFKENTNKFAMLISKHIKTVFLISYLVIQSSLQSHDIAVVCKN